jgi:hypothetical protein
MHRAGTALRDTATEFGAGHAEQIAQHPEQRHVIRRIDARRLAIYLQRRGHNRAPVIFSTETETPRLKNGQGGVLNIPAVQVAPACNPMLRESSGFAPPSLPACATRSHTMI